MADEVIAVKLLKKVVTLPALDLNGFDESVKRFTCHEQIRAGTSLQTHAPSSWGHGTAREMELWLSVISASRALTFGSVQRLTDKCSWIPGWAPARCPGCAVAASASSFRTREALKQHHVLTQHGTVQCFICVTQSLRGNRPSTSPTSLSDP